MHPHKPLLMKQPNLQPQKRLLPNRQLQNPCQQQNLHPTLHLLPKPLLNRLSLQHRLRPPLWLLLHQHRKTFS